MSSVAAGLRFDLKKSLKKSQSQTSVFSPQSPGGIFEMRIYAVVLPHNFFGQAVDVKSAVISFLENFEKVEGIGTDAFYIFKGDSAVVSGEFFQIRGFVADFEPFEIPPVFFPAEIYFFVKAPHLFSVIRVGIILRDDRSDEGLEIRESREDSRLPYFSEIVFENGVLPADRIKFPEVFVYSETVFYAFSYFFDFRRGQGCVRTDMQKRSFLDKIEFPRFVPYQNFSFRRVPVKKIKQTRAEYLFEIEIGQSYLYTQKRIFISKNTQKGKIEWLPATQIRKKTAADFAAK